MAPFPETEIMTIKRLEVAIRKQDFKLLKDGAYKLHEKYHSGFRFEYIDLLKEILCDVQNSSSIPGDIKDILIPTIEDILENSNSYDENEAEQTQNRVSSLTSLSYKPKNDDAKKAAFEAFIAPRTQDAPELQVQMQTAIQSPFSAQPFKEFSTPKVVSTTNISYEQQNNEPVQIQPEMQNEVINQQVEQVQNEQEETVEPQKTANVVSIFYGENSSVSENIIKYREFLKNGKNDLNEFLDLSAQINSQINTDTLELKSFVEQFISRNEKLNLVTASKSSMLVDVLNKAGVSCSLFNSSQDKKVNLVPFFGLSNLFKCSVCGYEHLNIEQETNSLVVKCPKCNKPMFANLYSAKDSSFEINLEYYNSAIVSLVESDVWFIFHQSLNEKVTLDLLKVALKISNVSKIFILDNDINAKETLKQVLLEQKVDVEINTQITAVENFFNSQ